MSYETILVEAKDAAQQLGGYDEQLGDCFAKDPDVKLGILTNGVAWRFFTDIVHANVMDREPFVTWDVLNDERLVQKLKRLKPPTSAKSTQLSAAP